MQINTDIRSDNGQTMTEYAVALTLITAAIVLAFTGLGNAISSSLERAAGIFS